ncbi:organoarsenical effux MFS transporter ArsJ [Marinagarivorans algicola]|uniref:organoarsenical effux MFS transporter ArsJ n=1 Tax=Marinagarivorans algicola TaxID=1513270 RepID=UPI000A69FA5A|nr:organoarsenical effux MFS transporter ArsJ [Marinagarivorans algicola]
MTIANKPPPLSQATPVRHHGQRQYMLITANYWGFTLTDGALRMLVVLHFHSLGFGALDIALLFIFYEFFGVVTNLAGGWLGARFGLNKTMNAGLALQILALSLLLVPTSWLTVPWVMAAQALSGIAKDLNKMSAKSAIKQLVPAGTTGNQYLFRAVAILTGSKNTLKGIGFFMGAALLAALHFKGAIVTMVSALTAVWAISLVCLQNDLGKVKHAPKFNTLLSHSKALNALSAARLFLFAARDIWFVVALPVFLSAQLGWPAQQIGAFFAYWIIGYGAVQAATPLLFKANNSVQTFAQKSRHWILALSAIPAIMALGGSEWSLALFEHTEFGRKLPSYLSPNAATQWLLMGGLSLFGIVFAINSSLHSYLILALARDHGTSIDVGFYYMANAAGRLLGTVLSGVMYQIYGLEVCLWGASLSLFIAGLFMARVKPEISV